MFNISSVFELIGNVRGKKVLDFDASVCKETGNDQCSYQFGL